MSTLPDDAFQVGDVVSLRGPSVPRDLWDVPLRVTAVDPASGLPKMRLLPRDETPAELKARAMAALNQAKAL